MSVNVNDFCFVLVLNQSPCQFQWNFEKLVKQSILGVKQGIFLLKLGKKYQIGYQIRSLIHPIS